MAEAIFCDVLGTRELLNLHDWAMASRCELRVTRPSAGVLRVGQLLGANQIFAIYATLGAAKSDGRPPGLSQKMEPPVPMTPDGQLRRADACKRPTEVK